MAIKLLIANPQAVKMIVGVSDAVGLKVESEIVQRMGDPFDGPERSTTAHAS